MKKFITKISKPFIRVWNWFLYEDGHLDWLKHDILGTIAYAITFIVMSFLQEQLLLSLILAIGAAIIIGVGREVYDQYKEGKEADAWDILWTIKTPIVISATIILFKVFMCH